MGPRLETAPDHDTAGPFDYSLRRGRSDQYKLFWPLMAGSIPDAWAGRRWR